MKVGLVHHTNWLFHIKGNKCKLKEKYLEQKYENAFDVIH